MKKALSFMIVIVFASSSFAVAANQSDSKYVPDVYKMDSMKTKGDKQGSGAKPSDPPPLPDFISPSAPLTPKERQSVKMTQDWASSGSAPIQANGKLLFVFGANIPTVIGAPNQICDIELQAGETVNDVISGDSARWVVEASKAGNAAHIVLKPLDAGLETNLVITTDRRTYHINLKSVQKGNTPHIAFTYPEDIHTKLKNNEEKDKKDHQWNTANVDGQPKDLSQLNFSYDIKGDASWKPLQVFDDGHQTFIKLPPQVESSDAPVVMARNNGQDTLVNFRMKNLTLLVDGVYPETILISGVGSKQQRITIRKK